MLDEVLSPLAEDGALVGPHAAQAEGEDDGRDEGDDGDGGSRDRNDPRRTGQLVHLVSRPRDSWGDRTSETRHRLRISRSPPGTVPAGAGCCDEVYWTVIGKLDVLLSTFFSPGTGTISA